MSSFGSNYQVKWDALKVNSEERKTRTIVHLSTAHQALDSRIHHRECRSISAAGYNVFLIAQHRGNETIDRVQIIGLRSMPNRLYRMTIGQLIALRKAIKLKPDLVHFHDPELLPLGFLLSFTRMKIVYDAHEDYVDQIMHKPWINPWGRRLISRFMAKLEPVAARRFVGTVVAPPATVERLQSSGIPNIIPVQNLPRLEDLPFVDSEVSNQSTSNPKRTFRLAYVGGITRVRGAIEMIEAIQLCKTDVRLTLAGDCSLELLETLQQLEGWNKVDYLGRIRPDEVMTVLQSADAGISILQPIKNYLEQYPTKVFEYMAAGIPFVVSNFPIMEDLVSSIGCGFLVDPFNIEEIANAVDGLSSLPDTGKLMGAKGREAAVETYNWDFEAKRLIAAYDSAFGFGSSSNQ